MEQNKPSFHNFFKNNHRFPKPRSSGITEIMGPYYSVPGPGYLEDLFGMMGSYIDSIKFAGGSFVVMESLALQKIINTAHDFEVMVSAGGFMEYVVTQGNGAVDNYLKSCKDFGFDIIELSAGFLSWPTDDFLRLIEKVQISGMKVKPEITIQDGAGRDSNIDNLNSVGQIDPAFLIMQAKKFLEAGAYLIMIESEGITENVEKWRTEIVAELVNEIGKEKLMFKAADPQVFEWYIQNYGQEVNLSVDHSQVIQLECLRQGIGKTGQYPGLKDKK